MESDDPIFGDIEETQNNNGHEAPAQAVVKMPPGRPANTVEVKQQLVQTAVVPPGGVSPFTGRQVTPATPTHVAPRTHHSNSEAKEFLERAMSNDAEMKRTAKWRIEVKRLGPPMYKGVPLDTTSILSDTSLMVAKDIEDMIKTSYGGGRYKADIISDTGIWQMMWQFAFAEHSCPPVTPMGSAMTPINDPAYDMRMEETRQRLDFERRKLEREEKREEEERQERRAAREKAERDAQAQSPVMNALVEFMKESARRAEENQKNQMNMMEKILTTLATPKTDNALPEMLKTITAVMESNKGNAKEQIEMEKVRAEAQKDIAKMNSDAAIKSAEASLKANEAATQRSDKFVELMIKNNNKEKSSLAEISETMKLIGSIRDNFGGVESPEPDNGMMQLLAPLAAAAGPKLMEWLQTWGSRHNTPAGEAIARAAGVQPGQAIDYDRLAMALQKQIAGVPKQNAPALPMAGTINVEGNPKTGVVNVETPATAPAPQAAPTQTPQPAADAPKPVMNLEEEMALTGSTREERRRDNALATAQIMLADAVDQRAQASWVEDALASWDGELLDAIVHAADEIARVNIIKSYADPAVWNKLEQVFVSNSKAYPVFIAGVRELVAQRQRKTARPIG